MTRLLASSRREFLWRSVSMGGAVLTSLRAGDHGSAQTSSDGIRVMAREKSLAEQFLTILNDFGRNNVGEYANGIVLYAQAKAEFDGLIAQLEDVLGDSKSPDQSERFAATLKDAVAKRVAFTSFITDTVIPHTDSAKKGIVGDFIQGGGELIKALTDAGLSIWREYRAGDEARRKEIRQELESLRWPQFAASKGN
jgi:hypothetical protein